MKMAITERQVELVQSTFQQVVPIADQAADMFYQRLFEIAPETQPLFKTTNMHVQGNKLMEMIGTAVAGLYSLEALVPAVKDLGARHVGYGVLNEYYQPVGEALLWTLEQGLGAVVFDAETKEAWTAVYTVLAETAIAGAAEKAS